MSDDYKVIREVKESILNLKSQGWTNNSIVNEIGISHTLLSEIMEYDVVSVKVREVTMGKMRDFLARNESGLDKPVRKKSGPKPKEEEDFPITVPESMKDAIPQDTTIDIGPVDPDGNLLNDLNELAKRFAKAGYQLNANIELQYKQR